MTERKPNLLRAATARASEESHAHPWNPRSELHGVRLGAATGLTRTGVNYLRIPPGKESFVYHTHRFEEEWIYVLEGRGVALVDGVEHEVGPGDFLGFPTPSVAHHMKNPFDADLVYLAGGEAREVEVADYPEHKKRMVRVGGEIVIYDLAAGEAFPGLPKL